MFPPAFEEAGVAAVFDEPFLRVDVLVGEIEAALDRYVRFAE